MTNKFSFKIGGMAGQGIKTAGLSFAKIAARSGYHIYNYIEYPSLIRGGHNVMQTVVSDEPIMAPVQHTNFLIALNQETLTLHQPEFVSDTGIVYESEGNLDVSSLSSYKLFPVPLKRIASTAGGSEIVINNVALGATLAILGGQIEYLEDMIKEALSHKDENLINVNLKACKDGYDYAREKYDTAFEHVLTPKEASTKNMVVNGTDAVAFGAIAGGMTFASIYPMSPTSNILHHLAANQHQYNYIFKQVEDEISAINMAIGASFAGARVMTTTSGGGFCLMTEGYGLAGQTETPIVIIEGQRGGPGTGLPTWSEQGDLQFVLHAHQGDFPRIVLAAGDAEEAFHLTMKCFNLAEKYQTPVVLLMDKNILDNEQTFPEFEYQDYVLDRGQVVNEKQENYQRYKNTPNGISPRSFPGLGNHVMANSDEHNQNGFSSETILDRNDQQRKRLRKLETCALDDMEPPKLFGPENADITIVSWGSNKGSILEVLKEFSNVNYLHLTWMNPFPSKAIQKILSNSKHLLDIECNSTGQLANLIRERTGIQIQDRYLKNDGRPIFPEEIIKIINIILKQS